MAEGTTELSKDVLGRAIKEVEKLMWGKSSYAVIYSAAIENSHFAGSASEFESIITSLESRMCLQYPCPPNTISSTIYNNPSLKLPIDKWEKHGVKTRSILLAKSFVQAIEDLQNE